MVVLVTGCAGFIGSNIVEKLLVLGHKVIGIDNLMTWFYKNIAPFENNSNFIFYKEDIRNISFLEFIFQKENITHVCHQAARGSVPKSIEDPILTNDINITGTLNILWISHKHNVKKCVCAISSSVYGDTPELPKIESMPYNPISPYALTKVTNEMYCKLFYEIYGLPTIWLRYFNVYWKRQDPNGSYAAIVPRWIQKSLNNENLELNWEWLQTRDFTYIDDVVDANILALFTENEDAYWKGMNICYNERIAIKELWNVILKTTKSSGILTHANVRKWDIQDSLGDFSLAHTLIWYTPKTDISVWIRHTLDWYKNNNNYFTTD